LKKVRGPTPPERASCSQSSFSAAVRVRAMARQDGGGGKVRQLLD
jgi:hypothetical protein